MPIETWLTFVLMAGTILAFAIYHTLLRKLPFEQAVPRERWRWPVWNWYALVVGIGILFGLVANLYWHARVPRSAPASEQEPAWSYDVRSPVNDADPNETIVDPDEVRRVRGEERERPR